MTTAAKIILTVTMRYIPQKIKNDESLGALVQIKVLFCMCYASISKKSLTACWHILKQWMQKMNSLPFFNTGWIHANAHGHKCSHENKKATTYFIIKNIFDLPNIFFMIKWTYGFYIFMWRNWEGWTGVHKQEMARGRRPMWKNRTGSNTCTNSSQNSR